MYSITNTGMGDATAVRRDKYTCIMDNVADAETLPTTWAPGSTAYTADMKAIFVLSPAGKWVRVGGTQ